jgi:hypothetical protein
MTERNRICIALTPAAVGRRAVADSIMRVVRQSLGISGLSTMPPINITLQSRWHPQVVDFDNELLRLLESAYALILGVFDFNREGMGTLISLRPVLAAVPHLFLISKLDPSVEVVVDCNRLGLCPSFIVVGNDSTYIGMAEPSRNRIVEGRRGALTRFEIEMLLNDRLAALAPTR